MYYDLLVGPIVALYTLIEHSLLWYTSIEQSFILLFRYTAMCVFDIFSTAVAGGQASEEESEEEEESDEEDSEEEDDDDMKHSGTESDKAVSIPPDVVPSTTTTTTAITEDTSPPDEGTSPPDEDASPPDAIASADHVTTGETSAVDTQQTKEPGQLLWGCHNFYPSRDVRSVSGIFKGTVRWYCLHHEAI